jgi:hypothetical protein
MIFRVLIASLILGSSASAVAAGGDMKVETFLAKADALKAKGVLALASSDIGLLKAEGKAAGEAYRARIKSDKAKKLPPHSCPPAKSSLKSDELLAHFRTYSVAQRQQISVRTALADLMKKRYPC